MFLINSKISNLLKTTLITLFSASLVVFIICSVGQIDLEINNQLAVLMDYKFFKFWAVFWASMGSLMPIYFGFIVICIWAETYFVRLKNNNKKNNFLHNFLKNNTVLIIFALYLIYFSVRIPMNVAFICSSDASTDFGWGVGNDVRTQASYIYRYVSRIIAVIIEFSLIITFAIFSRTVFERRQSFLHSNHWYTGLKVAIFFFYSYSMIWFFKHFSGRPYYFSVVYEEMTEKMKEMGWIESNNSPWGSAQYLPWYVPNNLFENLKHWFTMPPKSTSSTDQYWNMDFPSGHTTAMTIVTSFTAFFSSGRKERSHKIFYFMYVGSLLLVLNMCFTMVYYRFHWTTDVAWSLFIGILLWSLAHLTTNALVMKAILKWNLKNNIVNRGIISHNLENNQDVLFFIYYNQIIKVKQSKNNTVHDLVEKYQIKIIAENVQERMSDEFEIERKL